MPIKLFKAWLEEKIIRISTRKFSFKTFSLSWDDFFTVFLILISYIYGFIVKYRVLLYRKNFLKIRKLPCIVISIGNITAGGSGKTPMAIYLAEVIKKTGLKPVVLSRGYRGSMENGMGVAGDGSLVLSTPGDAGDEPYMMAKRCSFPVVVGKNRFKTGMMAIKLFNPDIIILDDGFQHVQLHRDIDLVLLDFKAPFGNKRLLPAGRLREFPCDMKKRADAVIFTRSQLRQSCKKGHVNDMNDNIPALDQCMMPKYHGKIKAMGKPFFYTSHKPFLLLFKKHDNITMHDNDSAGLNGYSLDKFSGKRALLFSGIADNSAFKRTVENLNILVTDHLEFMDHYRYNEQDIEYIIKKGKESEADLIMTTEKDYARLCDKIIDWEMDMAVIGIDIDWSVNGEKYDTEFLCFIKNRLHILSPELI